MSIGNERFLLGGGRIIPVPQLSFCTGVGVRKGKGEGKMGSVVAMSRAGLNAIGRRGRAVEPCEVEASNPPKHRTPDGASLLALLFGNPHASRSPQGASGLGDQIPVTSSTSIDAGRALHTHTGQPTNQPTNQPCRWAPFTTDRPPPPPGVVPPKCVGGTGFDVANVCRRCTVGAVGNDLHDYGECLHR